MKTKSAIAQRKGHWMQTYSGVQFYPEDPRPEEVTLLDIAHALSRLCRFAGHSTKHYSVAQHSVLVASYIRANGGTVTEQLWGLLHDAAEAYVIDLPWPVKQAPELAGYRLIESRVQHAVCDRFALPHEEPKIVKRADLVLLATEKRDVMFQQTIHIEKEKKNGWHCDDIAPLTEAIIPKEAYFAKQSFLDCAHTLLRQRSS